MTKIIPWVLCLMALLYCIGLYVGVGASLQAERISRIDREIASGAVVMIGGPLAGHSYWYCVQKPIRIADPATWNDPYGPVWFLDVLPGQSIALPDVHEVEALVSGGFIIPGVCPSDTY